jgi:glycosyltransferase involved in cell wall biosynthesis
MQSVDIVIPGDINTITGGYIYDKRMAEGLEALGWPTTVHSLHPSFPIPTAAAMADAAAVFRDIPDGRIVVIDGLALGGLADVLKANEDRLYLVALVHHPVAFEIGLYAARAKSLHQSEQASLAASQKVICTSGWTARALAQYEVQSDKVSVVAPGTDPAPIAQGSGSGVFNLLCVATVTARKGQAVLIDALEMLRNRKWHLHLVGSLTRDQIAADALRRQIGHARLEDRVTLHGEISSEARDACYAQADLFVLASNLEGYGMALAEALARGLPIVTTTSGAIPETVPQDAALFVPPGDGGALAEALGGLMQDGPARSKLKERALAARAALPTWETASRRFAAVLSDLVGH